MITAMFGQAFFIMLAVPDDKYVVDELAPPIIGFQSVRLMFFSLCLMLLGKLDEPESFEGPLPTGLFIAYTFIIFIIMLNVLIAIVSDSYDVVLVMSTELFWRSRLELIAEITTVFDWFLCGAKKWEKRVKHHFEVDCRLGFMTRLYLGETSEMGTTNGTMRTVRWQDAFGSCSFPSLSSSS